MFSDITSLQYIVRVCHSIPILQSAVLCTNLCAMFSAASPINVDIYVRACVDIIKGIYYPLHGFFLYLLHSRTHSTNARFWIVLDLAHII